MFRDDSVNSALLMVLVCGLEGAELLRCHAIAGRAGNYFCAVMVAVAAAPEPTTSCSLSFLLIIWSVSLFSVSFGINWGARLKGTVEAWLLNLKQEGQHES